MISLPLPRSRELGIRIPGTSIYRSRECSRHQQLQVMGKTIFRFPVTNKIRSRENGIPHSRHLYINITLAGRECAGTHPYSVGRYDHAPTHGREPTQHNREVKGK